MVDFNQQFNGVIGKVGIFPIKEAIKNQTVQKPGEHYGKQFNIEKTHTIAIKPVGMMIDGTPYDKWITLGHRKFNDGSDLSLRCEKSTDNWVDVWEGSKLFFWWGVENGYPKIDLKSIKIMELAPRPEKVYTFGVAAPSSTSPQQNSGQSYNPVGALQGNAFNGSMILLKDKYDSPKALETQLALKKINEEIKTQIPTANGAAIGMAILQACRTGEKIEKVKTIAVDILVTKIPALEVAWDKTPEVEEPKETKVKEPDAPKPGAEDFDPDDIPF